MECIDRILDFYKDKELLDTDLGKVQIGKVLVRLMQLLEEDSMNMDHVKNCLILLINLFFDIEAPDHYHNKGKSSQELPETEKTELLEVLRAEFSQNMNNHCSN